MITMAQRQVTVFIDDVTGDELEGGETVSFALDGVEYQIDLSEERADELRKAFAPYVLKGRRTGGRYARGGSASAGPPRRSPDSSSTGTSGRSKRDMQAIREWAQANGHKVSDRGRIPASVVEAYEAAH
jgi:hypothetical protein